MYAEVNQLFGDIVKVTPSSKVVGDMALFLMANELQPADILALDEKHDVSLPNSVVEMFSGVLGVPPGGWPKKLQKIILRGQAPCAGRPGASLEAVDLDKEQKALEKKLNHSIRRDDLLSYLLYPDVFTKYDKFRQTYGDVSVLPTYAFFYGLRSGEEITVEIEAGKSLIIRFLTFSEPRPDGTRTLFFELNGQPREAECARPLVAGCGAGASQGGSRGSGPGRGAHRGRHQRDCCAGQSGGGARRKIADAGSHEDAIQYLCA